MKMYILLSASLSLSLLGCHQITYQKNGGRLGDNLINYIKCRYLAYMYKLEFVYQPFVNSSYLSIHRSFGLVDRVRTAIQSEDSLRRQLTTKNSCTFETNFYTTLNIPQDFKKDPIDQTEGVYDFAISDQTFLQIVKNELYPRIAIKPLSIPEGYIPIAVHVRKGGGFDPPLSSLQIYEKPSFVQTSEPSRKGSSDEGNHRTKFPPEQYYIDQIELLSNAFDHHPLYVHIFTDDPNPCGILQRFKRALNKPNICFGCRTNENHHTKNVIQDLFSMASQYAILIRSSSSFAWAAQFLGNHSCIIAPLNGVWHHNMLIIDQTELIIPHKKKGTVTHYLLEKIPLFNLKKILRAIL